MDGVGEWATASIGVGRGNDIEMLSELQWPDSLGLLYSAFTYYTGFKVNSGEYKVMGLAPYGEPKYVDLIYKELMDLREDGSFRLNQKYFNYLTGLTMTNEAFDELFGGPPRVPESKLTQREMDLARSVQVVCEEVMLRMARTAHKLTGLDRLCLAGGVALNCVGNGRLLREGPFKEIWIQPAAGDAGGALGVAQLIHHRHLGQPRTVTAGRDSMKGSYLGPAFSPEQIEAYLKSVGAVVRAYGGSGAVRPGGGAPGRGADRRLVRRAHGVRSSLARRPQHPGRSAQPAHAGADEHQDQVPRRIPSVRAVGVARAGVRLLRTRRGFAVHAAGRAGEEGALHPADGRAARTLGHRQTERAALGHSGRHAHRLLGARPDGHEGSNGRYYDLIKAFERRTGCAVVVNTSFNVRGEPIVCTPEDAYRCFMRTHIDVLVLGPFVLEKSAQPEWKETQEWQQEFQLD